MQENKKGRLKSFQTAFFIPPALLKKPPNTSATPRGLRPRP